MNQNSALLMRWLDDQKHDLVESAMGLIREDAPKNKFSIITGRLLMVEETQSKLMEIESQPGPG